MCALPLLGGGCADAVVPITHWDLARGGVPLGTVEAPANFDERLQLGDVYTLTTSLPMPPSLAGRPTHLTIASLQGLVTLDGNGVRIDESFDPVPVLYRETGPHDWPLPASLMAASTLTLTLTVDHTWPTSGWLVAVPRLVTGGYDGYAMLAWMFNRVGTVVAFITLLQISCIYFAVYATNTHHKPYLWFALEAMGASAYAFLVTGALQTVLGGYDGPVEAAFIDLGLFFSIRFVHSYFQLGRPSRFWTVLLVVGAVGGFVQTDPYRAQPIWTSLTVASLVIVVVYQIVGFVRLVRREQAPVGAALMLTCWLTLGVGGFADGLAWIGLADPLEGARAACPALAVFALLQSLVLSRDHILSLATGERLNGALQQQVQQLEARQDEIAGLNGELQRQIVDRSRQLFAALGLVGRTDLVAPVLVSGDVIQDRYIVVREAGAGGMGAVYEVRRVSDGQRFALKVASRMEGPALARLAREAEIAAGLRHDNLVSVVDVDVARAGYLYVVMEFVDGDTAAAAIARRPSLAEGLALLADVAAGLAGLDQAGVVHRDLKPQNIMVQPLLGGGFRARIMDFGISRPSASPEPPPLKRIRSSLSSSTKTPSSSSSSSSSLGRPTASDATPSVRVDLGQATAESFPPRGPAEAHSKSNAGAVDSVDSVDSVDKADDAVARPNGATTSLRDVSPPLVMTARAGLSTAELIASQFAADMGDDDDNDDDSDKDDRPALQVLPSSSSLLTEFGVLIGTPFYLAPELAQGVEANAAVDIFSFGIIAHEVLVGRQPFAESVAAATLQGRRVAPATSLLVLCPGLDAAMAVLLDRCLSFSPGDRPTAQELASALRAAAAARAQAPPDDA